MAISRADRATLAGEGRVRTGIQKQKPLAACRGRRRLDALAVEPARGLDGFRAARRSDVRVDHSAHAMGNRSHDAREARALGREDDRGLRRADKLGAGRRVGGEARLREGLAGYGKKARRGAGDLGRLGIRLRVKDVVGVVATPGGAGYLLVGSDGGVFAFGTTRFYGSLPGLGKRVHDIRAILPSSTGLGYILVGADGGAFNFGTGARFHGSLPGEGVKVSDVAGLALTTDDGGYYMAGADGHVYGFGDAQAWAELAGVASNLPVAAIAGT